MMNYLNKILYTNKVSFYTNLYKILNWNINDSGRVDVINSVHIVNKKIKKLPFIFGNIHGDFNVSGNKLSNTKNFPYYLHGSLILNDNNLHTISDLPSCNNLFLANNPLTNLANVSNLELVILCITGCEKFNTIRNLPAHDHLYSIGTPIHHLLNVLSDEEYSVLFYDMRVTDGDILYKERLENFYIISDFPNRHDIKILNKYWKLV